MKTKNPIKAEYSAANRVTNILATFEEAARKRILAIVNDQKFESPAPVNCER